MARLNVDKARQLGYSDEEISSYLAKRPELAPQKTAPTGGGSNLLLTLAPLLGSLLGGAVGTAIAPGVGTIAGSAIGGGLGETARQGIGGEKISGGRIAGEAALGGLGGGLGVLLKGAKFGNTAAKVAKAGKATKAGKEVATGLEGVANRAGTGLRTGTYESAATNFLKGRNIAPRAKDVAETTTKFTGSASSKLGQLAEERAILTDSLNKLTSSKFAKTVPVEGSALLKNIATEVGTTVDVTQGIGKTNLAFWGNKIAKVKNAQDLGKVDKELLIAIQGAGKGKREALQAIQKVVGNALKSRIHETEPIFESLSKLNAAEPVVQKAAGATWTVPFTNIQVGTGGAQAAKDLLGRGVQATSKLPMSQVAGQAIPRAFTGGGTTEQYTPPTMQEMGPIQQYNQTPKDSGLKISPETVALAMLTLPSKQANAIKAAYEVLGGDTKVSANVQKRQLILNQAAPVVSRITESALVAPTGLAGSLASLFGRVPGVAGGEAEYLRRDTDAFARLIASAFASEVGVATDRDISRWKGLMPQPGDTHEERVRQVSKLIEQIYDESQSLGMDVPPEILETVSMLSGQ